MQALKGTPIFSGHRAWGSLFKLIFTILLLLGLTIYLYLKHPSYLGYVLLTYRIPITLEYLLGFVIFILIIALLYKHYRWTYIISTKEIIVKKGIIASDVKNYLYDQIQEVNTFQTVAQRILLYGQMSLTLLITLTGQSEPEKAYLQYLHRPRYLANLMIALLKIGRS